MPKVFNISLVSALIILLSALLNAGLLNGQNAPPASQPQISAAPYENTFFDPNPHHPWNQVYGMLFIRPGWDGKLYGLDEMDALYWTNTTYLLKAPIHQKALAALDKFIQSDSAHAVKDPLKRALLQRMLWALFDSMALMHEDLTPTKTELEVRIVKIMKSIALTDDEIKALPDNYNLEVVAKSYPSEFDPARPEQPFLPATFFSHADWVNLTSGNGPTAAPEHVQAVSCRSAFYVLISLPTGRADTLAYLKKLQDFEPHWVYYPNASGESFGINPHLPQVPPLTRFALVRRANLIDTKGEVVVSPLTESIQIRVIRSFSRGDPESQAFGLFTLDQTKLMQGQGGLMARSKSDLSFDLVLQHMISGGSDLLEHPDNRNPPSNGETAQLTSCLTCHAAPGIFSMNSYTQFTNEQTLEPPNLGEGDSAGQDAAGRKGREYNWGLLQAYWFQQN